MGLLSLIPGRLLAEGALALTAVTAWEVQSHRIASLRAERDEARAAQATEAATVATQAQALASWRERTEAAEAASQNASQQAARDHAALVAAAATRHTEESADAKLPDCQRLLAVDLAAVCPAHARWLHAGDPLR